jgi:hypothetical protein
MSGSNSGTKALNGNSQETNAADTTDTLKKSRFLYLIH